MGGEEFTLNIRSFLQKYNQIKQNRSITTWMIPFALLVPCVISYGILANKLGFFWDDWTIAYYIHFFKPPIFKAAFLLDRPLLGWYYFLTTDLIGESPFMWHLFSIFTRWICSLALWWTLKALWPRKVLEVTAISLLFIVYPGFGQQHIAITYSHFFIVLTITLISLGALNWGLRCSQWFWPLYLLSIVSSGLAIFTMEYFFGLEFLHPVFLWLILSETIVNIRKRLKLVVLYWLPYIALIILFLFWRVINETPRGEILIFKRLNTNPLSTISLMTRTIIHDLYQTSILAWAKIVDVSNILNSDPLIIRNYFFIIFGVTFFSFIILYNIRNKRNRGEDSGKIIKDSWVLQAIVIGLFALFLAGIPFWTTFSPISLTFPRDRFTLPFMLGASILLIGFVEALPVVVRFQNITIVGIAVGLAAGMHYQTSLSFYKDWLEQTNFLRQLTWRAPGIQPGTIIIVTDVPFIYELDNSLIPAINWIYAPNNTSTDFLYHYFNIESYLSRNQQALTEDMPIEIQWRLTRFEGTLSQAIFMIYRDQSCLKVVDPVTDRGYPEKPRFFREALQFSNPDLILTTATPVAQLPVSLFGAEPASDWCYYFEKAELASQKSDWKQVAELADKVLSSEKKFYRRNASELMPYIEGYAHVGQWEKAFQLSVKAYNAWENMRHMVCDIWDHIQQTSKSDPQGEETYLKIQQVMKCTSP